MNTSKIKPYAIEARRDFIKAVTERANFYGILGDDRIESIEFKGDVAIIGGRAFSRKEGELREKLVSRIKRDGFERVMRASAYTWFNRFVALRYMELHNYLEHGFRVLSHPAASGTPEILEHVAEIVLPGLNMEKAIELKLAGDKDNELYRLLIIAQCNALHRFMPFLFDQIDSETEILLPDNLLYSDSPIRKLVTRIDEADWKDVEIIGWIYQFYISERKDQVIGKMVKSEDIPAATQLFTPNWIVKYMVQNTLGRMWLATYPDSPLRSKMEYCIEPAEQEPEVQAELNRITPKALNPEEITFLDPACGSGHILVEAYEIFKEIYLERGYRTKDIPRLILEKNLYGLDIDDRAAQLSGIAVMMRARRDDRSVLSDNDLKLNIAAIQETGGLDAEDIAKKLVKGKVVRFGGKDQLFPDFKGQMGLKAIERPEVSREDIVELLDLFRQGKTFGSLISIPENVTAKLPLLSSLIEAKLNKGDIFEREAADKVNHILLHAIILSRKYDCVVTNPPYMGGKGLNQNLKDFARKSFPDSKSDLFAMFAERIMKIVPKNRYIGLMTPFTWMFLSSYEKLREKILNQNTLTSLIRPEYHAFFDSAYVPICTLTILSAQFSIFKGIFIDLDEFYGTDLQAPKTIEAIQNPSCHWRHTASAADFMKIPGAPIAYWASEGFVKSFGFGKTINNFSITREGMSTGDNDRFVRSWFEVDIGKIAIDCSREEAKASSRKWFPYLNGGSSRKWYGNLDDVVNWENDGQLLQSELDPTGTRVRAHNFNLDCIFKPMLTWSKINAHYFSVRSVGQGFHFSSGSPSMILNKDTKGLLCFLNSKIPLKFIKILNPTMNCNPGTIGAIPFLFPETSVDSIEIAAINIAKKDWDSYETSWNFNRFELLDKELFDSKIKETFKNFPMKWSKLSEELKEIEEENNRIFIKTFGLENDITPEVEIFDITLDRNVKNRYGSEKNDEKLESLSLSDTIKELISYSVGCMMGRYSLDETGLIYAHSGNVGFDKSKYKKFGADDDGIIPIMEQEWFPDDVANRFVEFMKVAWPPETLAENLKFVAHSLRPKNNEAPIDTIRRYLSIGFFKDHLKTYKKRPIYWLFSSGKHKAFECLVYLHRYNESTLSRMRSSYVTPLQGKFSARLEFLQNEKNAAATASAQRKIQKEMDDLRKKQAELSAFDDELRHYADMKISLDLDDGVKVNYGKFGNLLAEVNTITGKN